jgi:energy-coupling factor transporter transmembrane protein EcfT
MKKEFKWQYSWEKVLFKIKEHILSFIISKIWVVIAFVIFITILAFILVYFGYKIIAFIIVIISFLLILFYYWFLYKDSFLYFTSRRVIKQIRNWIFFKHRKILKILDIKWAMSNKKWFLQTFLRIWNIKIEWTEKEANIYFVWIKEYEEIANYIARVVDYIKINWHTDNIARYKIKKERNNLDK